MNLPAIIYYFCCGMFGVMMSICGYSVMDWQFWVGIALVITAHICGKKSRN